MKFENVRLVGFKSFVEPTDFRVMPGLTGIVGPNGCGKSNILESMRWVMGATSAKALRGAGMEDVIFAGTKHRPARNWAEVTLTIDNADRTAPAEFNDLETLEVSRRIVKREDGAGSIYRINGKEVRARDVQLLFADASTGANSPALVRQGQVAELISAKPQNRRKLLEEAAGVSGLHSRRHEAELRLRAAEQNLSRLDDVLGELDSQRATLAKQARQATRYRNLSGHIRRAEAMASYLRWSEAREAQDAANAALAAISETIETTARAAASAAAEQARAHEAEEPLRRKEAETAAALHRLNVAREQLEAEAERAAREAERLRNEVERITADIAREKDLAHDADDALDALAREADGLKTRDATDTERLANAERDSNEAADRLASAESDLERLSAEAAELEARRKALSAARDQAEGRLRRISQQVESLRQERARVAPSAEQSVALKEAEARKAAADAAFNEAEAALKACEDARALAVGEEEALREPRRKAEQARAELAAEIDALKRVLAAHAPDVWQPLIERLSVQPGYENALAAALGDDLGAAIEDEAPVHWSGVGKTPAGAPLPAQAEALSAFVDAPPELARRLAAVGVVAAELGELLQGELQPGQRLVSPEGDLWRWDGFVARAEAKTAAAIRLEQRNRLAGLEEALPEADARTERARAAHAQAVESAASRKTQEQAAREALASARRAAETAHTEWTRIERDLERASTRLSAIDDNLARGEDDEREGARVFSDAREALEALGDSAAVLEQLQAARTRTTALRAEAAEVRAAHASLAREAEMRARRMQEIARERGVWSERAETAARRIAELETRRETAAAERDAAQNAPNLLHEKEHALLDELGAAESRRRAAGDALAEALNIAQAADRHARDCDAAAGEARERRARLEAEADGANTRVEEAAARARETCESEPENLLELAEHKDGASLPERAVIDAKLEKLKRERETLGGVNLRADEEMQELEERLNELSTEREDCEAAIRKLRGAIGNLNREGRQRLVSAFDTVNRNFQDLFVRLFGGGQAELRLVDSEDPLEAGLEIFASPPGKKLASMSLMSGGEQALTATALIFAVFLANPAPVCVLDEVDAPLDDANVDRFCHLLDEMSRMTETRFIVITHHALTMSRMHRLYGVTMIERGVSQLVSVDLASAERMVAAE